MVKQEQKVNPNYHRIYSDLISKKFPERLKEFDTHFFSKKVLSCADILSLNKQLFGAKEDSSNTKLRSYGKNDILKILKDQKKLNLNNKQAADYFKISRNSIIKWKKIFAV